MSEDIGYAVCQRKIGSTWRMFVENIDNLWLVDRETGSYVKCTKPGLKKNLKTGNKQSVRIKSEENNRDVYTLVFVRQVFDTYAEGNAFLKGSGLRSRFKRLRSIKVHSHTPQQYVVKQGTIRRNSQQVKARMKMQKKKQLDEKKALEKARSEAIRRAEKEIMDEKEYFETPRQQRQEQVSVIDEAVIVDEKSDPEQMSTNDVMKSAENLFSPTPVEKEPIELLNQNSEIEIQIAEPKDVEKPKNINTEKVTHDGIVTSLPNQLSPKLLETPLLPLNNELIKNSLIKELSSPSPVKQLINRNDGYFTNSNDANDGNFTNNNDGNDGSDDIINSAENRVSLTPLEKELIELFNERSEIEMKIAEQKDVEKPKRINAEKVTHDGIVTSLPNQLSPKLLETPLLPLNNELIKNSLIKELSSPSPVKQLINRNDGNDGYFTNSNDANDGNFTNNNDGNNGSDDIINSAENRVSLTPLEKELIELFNERSEIEMKIAEQKHVEKPKRINTEKVTHDGISKSLPNQLSPKLLETPLLPLNNELIKKSLIKELSSPSPVMQLVNRNDGNDGSFTNSNDANDGNFTNNNDGNDGNLTDSNDGNDGNLTDSNVGNLTDSNDGNDGNLTDTNDGNDGIDDSRISQSLSMSRKSKISIEGQKELQQKRSKPKIVKIEEFTNGKYVRCQPFAPITSTPNRNYQNVTTKPKLPDTDTSLELTDKTKSSVGHTKGSSANLINRPKKKLTTISKRKFRSKKRVTFDDLTNVVKEFKEEINKGIGKFRTMQWKMVRKVVQCVNEKNEKPNENVIEDATVPMNIIDIINVAPDNDGKITVVPEGPEVFKKAFLQATEEGTVVGRIYKCIESLWDYPTRLTLSVGKRISNNYTALGDEGTKKVIEVFKLTNQVQPIPRCQILNKETVKGLMARKFKNDRSNDKRKEDKRKAPKKRGRRAIRPIIDSTDDSDTELMSSKPSTSGCSVQSTKGKQRIVDSTSDSSS